MENSSAGMSVLWAKSDPPHPLWCHLLDVGAVLEALWDEVLTEGARERMARALGVSVPEARSLVVWLGALHDIGKATPAFQAQYAPLAQHVAALVPGAFGNAKPAWAPHGVMGAVILSEFLRKEWGWNGRWCVAVCSAIGAHHGTVDSPRDARPGSGVWTDLRRCLIELITKAFGGESFQALRPVQIDPVGLVEVAGFVSYADWIGSALERSVAWNDTHLFCGTVGVEEYLGDARARARVALARFGWKRLPSLSSDKSWSTNFGGGFLPNPLQQEVERLLANDPGTRLLLIEAPMGEGKTEAALFAARHWMEHFHQPGFYLGLPTQATSNAMYERVDRWLERLYAGESIDSLLVHGGLLYPEYFSDKLGAARVQDWGEQGGKDSPAPPATTVHGWFLPTKRALLAPFGTGTIDQALVGALMVRHFFIRLAGLAGKTIIFDEVHAYDAYTSHLLERLLEYLARLDCTVVLLSATLPAEKRRELVKAFSRAENEETESSAAYPRITSWAPTQGVKTVAGFETSTRARKNLLLKRLPWDLEEAIQEFVAALGESGCGAFLVNTVGEAQDAFLKMQGLFPGAFEELIVFHSRFPNGDRTRIERRVQQLFGKGGQRPTGKAMMIATQVAEQSLDLDFDVMASTVAPIDLLLQRAGRLHRHNRSRPEHHGTPVLYIRIPPGSEEVPTYGNTERIYDRAILMRTHHAVEEMIREQRPLLIPEDVSAVIEEVYGGAAVEGQTPAWRKSLEEAEAIRMKMTDEYRNTAEGKLLLSPFCKQVSDLWAPTQDVPEDDELTGEKVHRALTRLGDETITAVCVHVVDGRRCLDEAGEIPLPLKPDPTGEEYRQIVERMVRLPGRLLGIMSVQSGERLQPLPDWSHHRVLRQVRLVEFVGGRCVLDRKTELAIHESLGVRLIWN